MTQSTFSGIELGKRGLIAQRQGLTVAGHNLSNASTEGYSRQRVKMGAIDPLYRPDLTRPERAGQVGQGVQVQAIERVRDTFYENRILSQGGNTGYWESREFYIDMVGRVYKEPNDINIRTLMDRYWDGWQKLSANPESIDSRHEVLQYGEALIEEINSDFRQLNEIRTLLDDNIKHQVSQMNSITLGIAELNREIKRSEALGDNPNDLLDRRDLLVEKLSEFVPVTVDHRDPDEFLVHTGGLHLVQGNEAFLLETATNPNNEGLIDVYWQIDGESFLPMRGSLGALLELRDVDVREEIQNLDTLTVNFVDMVNEIHREGWGLSRDTGLDYFIEQPFVLNVNGNYDRTGDGEFDSTYIFRMSGSEPLELKQQTGLGGTITLSGKSGNVAIEYTPTDTVEEIIAKINNSDAEVTAHLNREGLLTLKGTVADNYENPDFVIRYVADDGLFLTNYAGLLADQGDDAAYNWEQADAVQLLRENEVSYAVAPLSHPSGWIATNPLLLSDPSRIATGLEQDGSAPALGDNRAALAIAALRSGPVMVGKESTLGDYFSETVAKIGVKASVSKEMSESYQVVMKDLKDVRDSISGVNIDEEFAEIIKFQHGYQAAARFITEFDKLLDTIINRLGV